MSGRRFLVTAGPTYEPIDPVRFIGNHSSGKMGFATAEALAKAGAEVILIAGPTNLSVESNRIRRIDVTTADEMYAACHSFFNECDGAILSAAVADYKVENASSLKIKKKEGESGISLRLVENKDILASLGVIKKSGQVLVGFSLETHNEKEFALAKLRKKNCDLIILNSLADPGAGFSKDTNKITILDKFGHEKAFPLKSKKEVAEDIIAAMIKFF